MSRIRPETHLLPRAQGYARVAASDRSPTAVVVGGGIAGIAAATVLCERGVKVTLLEREAELGGRAGGFSEALPTGEHVYMERGFHGFFRQYYTLRALLSRIDPTLSMLTELSDYPVLGPGGETQSFAGLPKRTPFQVMALTMRTPHLSARDLAGVNGLAALEMLAFDPKRTYERFDRMTAAEYLASLAMPERARRMLFDVFAHSFFNPEQDMSAAELLMMFHFYFTGNPEGLIFDVANKPLGVALWRPFAKYLGARGTHIENCAAVSRIEVSSDRGSPTGQRFTVAHGRGELSADMLVLALDVGGLQAVIADSPDLSALWPSVSAMRATNPFAVLRLWLDRPVQSDRVAFAGTTGVGMLDNISVYERFQDESAAWASANRGSVVELHAYAVPKDAEPHAVRYDLISGLHTFYPETRSARIVHERFMLRSDCPAFPPGGHALRPAVATALPGVTLAGDGIAAPVPCALMERAAITGFLAANTLLAPLHVAPEPIRSVPSQGLFALPTFLSGLRGAAHPEAAQ
jgi:isorenieratene synthase